MKFVIKFRPCIQTSITFTESHAAARVVIELFDLRFTLGSIAFRLIIAVFILNSIFKELNLSLAFAYQMSSDKLLWF